MSENKRYYWLKLNEDFFEDDTIQWLEEQESGKDYVIFYLKLCLKSLKDDGNLIRYVGQKLLPYNVSALARLTGTHPDTVAVAMKAFQEMGLIEIKDTGEIYLSQIDEMIGRETDSAKRMRKKRLRDKLEKGQLKSDGRKGTTLQENVTMLQEKETSQSYGENVTELQGNRHNVTEKRNSIQKCDTEYRDKSIENRVKSKEHHHHQQEHPNAKSEQAFDSEPMDDEVDDMPSPHDFYQKNIGVLNPYVSDSILHWIKDLNEELVIEALKRSVSASNPWRYAETILNNWLRANVSTLDDVESNDIAHSRNSHRGQNNKADDVDKNAATFGVPLDDFSKLNNQEKYFAELIYKANKQLIKPIVSESKVKDMQKVYNATREEYAKNYTVLDNETFEKYSEFEKANRYK